MSKYSPLTHHLQSCAQPEVPMHFAEIEAILGFALPPSARQHRGWWSNNPVNNVMTKAWLAAGYTTRAVDLAGAHLVFAKSAPAQMPILGFEESPAPIWAGQVPKALSGEHPLFGCMAGTVRVEAAFDLTAPLYAYTDLENWMDQKAAHLRGAPQ